jgi:hypothetical protein
MDAEVIGIEAAEGAARQGGRKRRGRVAPPPERADAGKVKTSVTLSLSAWRRLNHHAVGEGKKPAAVMEELIEQHLRRFRVQDLRAGGEEETRGVA